MAEPPPQPPRFAPGTLVRATTTDPPWHTRVPRYVRGHAGRVVAVAGRWPLADDVARGTAEPRTEPVYTVAFAASDLWGGGGHEVTVDLWQSYLEAAEATEPTEPTEPTEAGGAAEADGETTGGEEHP